MWRHFRHLDMESFYFRFGETLDVKNIGFANFMSRQKEGALGHYRKYLR